MHAVRNIDRCTKDCICLYVCPTGASDTETGQIDFTKCIGCGACANACPSHAIVMVPEEYPPQQEKEEAVLSTLRRLADSKTRQEQMAGGIAAFTEDPIENQFARAIAMANRIMAEDIFREASYMLPQSKETGELLHHILAQTTVDPDKEPKTPLPADCIQAATELLRLLNH